MANTEQWFVKNANGSTLGVVKPHPNQEAAEDAARELLAGGTVGPLFVVQVVSTEISRFESSTSITKTVL